MPGIQMDGAVDGENMHEQNGDMDKSPESVVVQQSPPSGVPEDGVVVDTSIEKLYENVYEMQSSDQSPSRDSFESDGEESRIDLELRHLVGGESREVELMEEEKEVEKQEHDSRSDATSLDSSKKSGKLKKIRSPSTKNESAAMSKLHSKSKSPSEKPSVDKSRDGMRTSLGISSVKKPKRLSSVGFKIQNGTANTSESKPSDPNLGPFLLEC